MKYLYESPSNEPGWPLGDFVSPNSNEKELQKLEDRFAPVLRKAVALCVPGLPFPGITKSDEDEIAAFAANMIARNPLMLEENRKDLSFVKYEKLEPFRKVLEQFGFGNVFEGAIREAATRCLLFSAGPGSIQGSMIADIKNLEGIVLRAGRDSHFVTTSMPPLPSVKEKDGVLRLVALYLPLGPDAAILYGEGESPGISRCISVGSDIVDKLNFAALASPNARYVIAKERKTLESLIELWGKVTGLSLSFFQSIL